MERRLEAAVQALLGEHFDLYFMLFSEQNPSDLKETIIKKISIVPCPCLNLHRGSAGTDFRETLLRKRFRGTVSERSCWGWISQNGAKKINTCGRVGNEHNTSLIRTYSSSVWSSKKQKEQGCRKANVYTNTRHWLALVWHNMHMYNRAYYISVGWVSCTGCRPSCCQIWTIPRERRHTSLHV